MKARPLLLRLPGVSPRPWQLLALLGAALAALPLAPTLLPLLDASGLGELTDPRLAVLALRTAGMSAAAALVALLAGAPLGLLAARSRLALAGVAAVLLPLPLFLPPLLLAQAWHGLTGLDGLHAAWLCLGLAWAPVPALLAARALAAQGASSHEAALLLGPGAAAREMLRLARPALALGAALVFVLAASDFAVPDYFSAVADEKFHVYAFEVFQRWRRIGLGAAPGEDPAAAFQSGLGEAAAAAAPLVLLAAAVLLPALAWREGLAARQPGHALRRPAPLPVPRALGEGLLLLLLALVLLLPLGRILYETGMHGPARPEPWTERSARAFADALERGREPILRSLGIGARSAFLVLLLAPLLAWFLGGLRRRWLRRLLELLLALPLLCPSVALGVGAILVWNRPELRPFYSSPWMPAGVLAGRFLPVAVFLLRERMEHIPRAREDAALLAGLSWPWRLARVQLGGEGASLLLACGLVAVLAMKELDLAILLPAANPTAVVRYYNALHFARDNFVAAFGLLFALVLFLPAALAAAWRGLRPGEEAP